MAFNHDPKTKADIIDRVLRRDFNGDFTQLGQDGQVILDRKKANVLALKFQNSGEIFELTVHKRREQAGRRPVRKAAAPMASSSSAQAPEPQAPAKVGRQRKSATS